MTVNFSASAAGRALALLLLVTASGCKESTLDPSARGALAGQVLDYVTGAPIPGAAITTAPPSESVLTGPEGEFRIEGLEVGSYQVTARKFGYSPASVGVAVREGSPVSAVILLEQKDADEAESAPVLDAEVLNFWNVVHGDSTYVETEYRVRNVGGVAAEEYEIYFRISAASETTYFYDEAGTGLAAGQADIKRFRLYLPTPPATAVQVDTLWSDPPMPAD